MTTTTTPAEIRWEPAEDGGFTGHIGTLEAFRIAPAGEGEKWTWHLTSRLPGQQDDHGWVMDPIVAKVTAERWHATYLSSRPYVAAALAALRAEITRDAETAQELGDGYSEHGTDPSWDFANQHWGRAGALREVLAAMDRLEAGQ